MSTKVAYLEAIHEAGHAVVAHALGFIVVSIELHESGPVCGHLIPENPTPLEHLLIATVCMAGGQAEAISGSKPDIGSIQDLNNAAESILEYVDGDERSVNAYLCHAVELSANILRGRWPIVENLAEKIINSNCNLDADDLALILCVDNKFEMVDLE